MQTKVGNANFPGNVSVISDVMFMVISKGTQVSIKVEEHSRFENLSFNKSYKNLYLFSNLKMHPTNDRKVSECGAIHF